MDSIGFDGKEFKVTFDEPYYGKDDIVYICGIDPYKRLNWIQRLLRKTGWFYKTSNGSYRVIETNDSTTIECIKIK